MPLPLSASPAHVCVKNVFARPAGSEDRSLRIGRRAKSHAYTSACIKDSHAQNTDKYTSTCTQQHIVTALFQSSLSSGHIQCVDKSDSVLRWQAGCVSLSAEWYSIIRNQESDNLFVSLHTPSPALQMEAQCNFHLWIYCKANSIRCLPAPQTHPE